MQRLTKACCEKCTHTPTTPCVQYVVCRTHGPLCHEDVTCQQQRKELQARIQREQIDFPIVTIGTGTCGRGAGALKILQTVHTWATNGGAKVHVEETGCIGMCTAEPLFDIHVPGRARLFFVMYAKIRYLAF